MIELERDLCGDLDRSLQREWLETNGIGGFASSTVPGLNSRRYHGLLVASLRPPVERFVLLSKLEETVVLDGERIDLGTNAYGGAVHPDGYRRLVRFRLDPFPIWTFRLGRIEIEKRLFMVQGENTVVVRYELRANPEAGSVRLEVRPLIAFRDYHALTQENPVLDGGYDEAPGRVTLRPYPGLPAFHVAHDARGVERQGYWYRGFEYGEERERGLEFREDLYNPLALHFDLSPGQPVAVLAGLNQHREAAHAATLEEGERQRRQLLAASAPVEDPLVRALTCAADQFVSRRGDGETLLAGFPWFTDWGRDTMIAFPGLVLVTGRHETARQILREYARHVDRGMLPNRFPDHGEEPEYNTVDATLWLFEAVRAFGRYTGDYDFIRDELYPVLQDILEWHGKGTRHGIQLDGDGLLRAGEEGVQLTWMDARVGDYVVTPRYGKPVEIQALWYNALRVMQDLASRFGDEGNAKDYGRAAAQASRSFNRRFWSPERGYLADVVENESPDFSLRPNQILAVSLAHSMLSREKARAVVEAVQRHLLTPCGLRTLAPQDERYRGKYEGDVLKRDARYHQGTAWPWLLGPFVTAYVRVHGGSRRARQQAAAFLAPLREHLLEAGLGQVSEILDGGAPHAPRGCIAQAWSVGELLRCAVEDVFGIAPGTQP